MRWPAGGKFKGMAEFFAMGGHAVYVWSAYAVTAVVLVAMLAATLLGLRRREAVLRALEGDRPRRRRRERQAAAGTGTGTIAPGERH